MAMVGNTNQRSSWARQIWSIPDMVSSRLISYFVVIGGGCLLSCGCHVSARRTCLPALAWSWVLVLAGAVATWWRASDGWIGRGGRSVTAVAAAVDAHWLCRHRWRVPPLLLSSFYPWDGIACTMRWPTWLDNAGPSEVGFGRSPCTPFGVIPHSPAAHRAQLHGVLCRSCHHHVYALPDGVIRLRHGATPRRPWKGAGSSLFPCVQPLCSVSALVPPSDCVPAPAPRVLSDVLSPCSTVGCRQSAAVRRGPGARGRGPLPSAGPPRQPLERSDPNRTSATYGAGCGAPTAAVHDSPVSNCRTRYHLSVVVVVSGCTRCVSWVVAMEVTWMARHSLWPEKVVVLCWLLPCWLCHPTCVAAVDVWMMRGGHG